MAIQGATKTMKVTVGNFIAAVFDIVGDHVDRAVDMVRFNESRTRAIMVVEERDSRIKPKPS